MHVQRLTPAMMSLLTCPPGQQEWHTPQIRQAICLAPNVAMALIDLDGLVAAAGVIAQTPQRGFAWFQATPLLRRWQYRRVMRECRAQIARQHAMGMWRIECTVLSDESRLADWAAALGFEREGRMRCWRQDGADCDLWASVREPGSPA